MRGRAAARVILVVALALLFQTTVVLDVRIGGVSPNVMILLPIAAGVAAGPIEGAGVGFVAGLAADLLSPTPLGLSALVGTIVGFGVGALSGGMVREVRGLPTVVALGASAVAVILYAVLGALLGEPQFLHVNLALVVAVVAVANALLAGLAVRLMRRALGSPADQLAAGSIR
ncbi:MAG: rod shape-determining protein MreD [Acidimicrobiales bacterium]